MAYAKKTNYSSASRPSQGGEVVDGGSVEEIAVPNPETATTHYAKINKEYANGIFIWENENDYGTYLKMRVTAVLQPGDYFIAKKKAK